MQNQYIYIAFVNLFLNLNTNAKMKKLFITALAISGIVLACQKEDTQNVTPAQKNALTPEEEQVSKSLGKIVAFNDVKPSIDAYQKENPDATRYITYGKEAIEQILNQKGCVGVRFYLAKEGDKTTVVFVGIDKNKKDIKGNPSARTNDGGSAGGGGPMCPQYCE